jgi:hypothetical protein
MMFVYIGITTSIAEVLKAGAKKNKNHAASISALFFIYAHSPAYNIGNNALTYSRCSQMDSQIFYIDAGL